MMDAIDELVDWQMTKQTETYQEPLCNHAYQNCVCIKCGWGSS